MKITLFVASSSRQARTGRLNSTGPQIPFSWTIMKPYQVTVQSNMKISGALGMYPFFNERTRVVHDVIRLAGVGKKTNLIAGSSVRTKGTIRT